jgi:hypothetical protein
MVPRARLESGPRSALPPLTFSRQCVERLTGLDKNRGVAGCCRVLAHDHLDIERVQVDTRLTLPILSAAMRAEPEPRNGSMTMSPRLETAQGQNFWPEGCPPRP